MIIKVFFFQYQRKFARFKKQHSANFKNKTSGYKAVNEFKSTYKYVKKNEFYNYFCFWH